MDFGKTSACRKLREKLIDKNFSELCYGALEWENDFYSVFNIGDKKSEYTLPEIMAQFYVKL